MLFRSSRRVPECLFDGMIATVEHSILLFSLWDALCCLHVFNLASHITSMNTILVSVIIVLVVVASLVARLRQIERRPSAVSSDQSPFFICLTFVRVQLLIKLSFPSAR